jgi:hypothetical protein
VLKAFLTTCIAGLALATVAVARQTPPSGPTFEVADIPMADLQAMAMKAAAAAGRLPRKTSARLRSRRARPRGLDRVVVAQYRIVR